MKIKFQNQAFQTAAAQAVVDVFAGQPYATPTYLIDRGKGSYQQHMLDTKAFTGFRNAPIVNELTDEQILKNIRAIQRKQEISPSEILSGSRNNYHLSVEMETGVGKTYTYIKTMYELNRAYGWSKFIIVVPSIAIREGVYKSFQITQDHFAQEYGKKIRYFIYNSARLTEIEHFASDNNIHAMIINMQAFNAKGKDANRIRQKLDEFRSRRPIDILAKTNPILIIDEPQSVEGKETKASLKDFNALLTLRYSATHKKDNIQNMVFRLDAMEAYNRHLVKKISVKGITEQNVNTGGAYLYLERINVSDNKNPTASLRFHINRSNGVKEQLRICKEGDNLYHLSNELEAYRNNFVISSINGLDNTISFLNGITLRAGQLLRDASTAKKGQETELQLRRIQIRETILSHIERERFLFAQGIKVLSLFFIDEVANYRQYEDGKPGNGVFAEIFEEEYRSIVEQLQYTLEEEKDGRYQAYLAAIAPEKTHAGYFSMDKKGKLVNSKEKSKSEEDTSAYELIMKNKELLLDRDPRRSPVRFIFSHSALREGWDNPNVFQICTLKQSGSEVRKRQEVGRGLRLCINQDGERMDESRLGEDVHNVNVLTVIASESYDSFAKALQTEYAEAVGDRPRTVSIALFQNRSISDVSGKKIRIDDKFAQMICMDLHSRGYIDLQGHPTEKLEQAKNNNVIELDTQLQAYAPSILEITKTVFSMDSIKIENAGEKNVDVKLDTEKLQSRAFQNLWKQINRKSLYTVNFDSEELIHNSILALNEHLRISRSMVQVQEGHMQKIDSKQALEDGESFEKGKIHSYEMEAGRQSVKYDLLGKLSEHTALSRKSLIAILRGIEPKVFEQFRYSPEEFIKRAGDLINEQKASAVIEKLTYHVLEDRFESDVFQQSNLKGVAGKNTIKTEKHLYDHLLYDSDTERKFAEDLDAHAEVVVYAKLPKKFHISTPVGQYNPDWAIAFDEGEVKHIYFVAETKGSLSSLQLRGIEEAKIACAKKHFASISNNQVKYDVVHSYESLLEKIRG